MIEARKKKQAERGRVVYIIEVEGYPETNKRHAYRTEGICRAAATAMGLKSFKVTAYVPLAGC